MIETYHLGTTPTYGLQQINRRSVSLSLQINVKLRIAVYFKSLCVSAPLRAKKLCFLFLLRHFHIQYFHQQREGNRKIQIAFRHHINMVSEERSMRQMSAFGD